MCTVNAAPKANREICLGCLNPSAILKVARFPGFSPPPNHVAFALNDHFPRPEKSYNRFRKQKSTTFNSCYLAHLGTPKPTHTDCLQFQFFTDREPLQDSATHLKRASSHHYHTQFYYYCFLCESAHALIPDRPVLRT